MTRARLHSWFCTLCCVLVVVSGCSEEGDLPVLGEGEAEGERDPCEDGRSGDRRNGIVPGACPGTSTACSGADIMPPLACNVRPPNKSCASPPGTAKVLEVCAACTYTTIKAALAAIPDPPGTEYWIVVHAGTYKENVIVTQASSSSDPITIAARCNGSSRDAVTIRYSTDEPVLKADFGADSVTFEGFRVEASPIASGEGAVALVGDAGTARYIAVDGSGAQGAFYVEGYDCRLEEVDSQSSFYGVDVYGGDGLVIERGAFCDSKDYGIVLYGGVKLTVRATLVKDGGAFGAQVDFTDTVILDRLLSTGHLAAAGGGLEVLDATNTEVWHSRFVNNRFGAVLDIGAIDTDFENTLFERNENGVLVNTSYAANDTLDVEFCTFADGLYGMRLLAPIKVDLRRNIFFAGNMPGGYGIDITDGFVSFANTDENLFHGNFGSNQMCIEATPGQCTGVVWSTGDPHVNADGYYLEQGLSAAVDAASDSAASVSLDDGSTLDRYTTALDLVLDGGNADLGFHHRPCCEECDDECGDGFCAGSEIPATCGADCL